MNYVLLYLFLLPIQKLFLIFKKTTGRNLIIQTAKIGDFINITPMIRALGHSDVLISSIVEPLACHDDNIHKYYLIEDAKRSVIHIIILLIKLINRYDNIYVVHPNSINLFFASLCNAPNKQFLKTYAYKPYHKIFYYSALGIVEHRKKDLTLNSYLKLINRNFCYKDFPKYATSPLYIPTYIPQALRIPIKEIKIGISISAGNKSKTIPSSIFCDLINSLEELPCIFFIFGVVEEQVYFNELIKLIGNKKNIINLIGQFNLEAVPWAISQMHIYISSDSGNAYIADSQNIPIIMFYGPCEIKEQRPINNVLFIGAKNIPASTFVFSTKSKFEYDTKFLFNVDEEKIFKIKKFIKNNFLVLK
ncbi:glycosyltransferase family 9 protein [Pantoea sp. Aalb]|uniref:glycosyltransferase family 9 protein n=1 Tax=Pantoea sp. Aalb TaxID=2576762 RepID=UPI00132C8A21|nr:glycosyltransferase family 9 protein [Pantoea sp. Aalb]MXP67938.1 glycosyltransferase family 9 protein [Pantoea sp. Aalb]